MRLVFIFLLMVSVGYAQSDSIAYTIQQDSLDSIDRPDSVVTHLVGNDSIDATLDYSYLSVQLSEYCAINVPKGYKYLSAQQIRHVWKGIKNDPRRVPAGKGVLLPVDQSILDSAANWIYLDVVDTGYVEEDVWSDINLGEVLFNIQTRVAMLRDSARKYKEPVVHLMGWKEIPSQDSILHQLSWSELYMQDWKNDNLVQIQRRVLTRNGFFSLRTMVDEDDFESQLIVVNQVLDNLDLQIGSRYSDFKSGERMAPYRSAHLINPHGVQEKSFFMRNWQWIVAIGLFLLLVYRRFIVQNRKEEEG